MADVNDLLKNAGMEDLGLGSEGIKNTGTTYYEHLLGDYQALIGKVIVTLKDKEDKKCEKGTPGAVIGTIRVQLLVIKDPEARLVDDSLNFAEDIPYGRLIFNQFIPHDPNMQWVNVRSFADFTINGMEEAAVIQGKKNEEQVFVNNLQLFYGTFCTFTIEAGTKKPGSRFITSGSLKLSDHSTLNEELMTKRKALADKLTNKLELHLETQKKKKDAISKESAEPSAPIETSFLDAGSFS